MKIVVAPQGFKGTLSPFAVSSAIRDGIKRVFSNANIILAPMADGGDGTLDVLLDSLSGHHNKSIVTGPIGNFIEISWGVVGNIVIIETAKICGLAITAANQRNPLRTTTYGVGEVIREALDTGFRNFVIGIGGTATNDGGAGMAQALGAHLLNNMGSEIRRGCNELSSITKVDITDLDPRIKESKFLIACDVLNPLTGPEGASMVYGPQKGASQIDVEVMEEALIHYAAVIKRDLKIDIDKLQGAGAGGGLGGGCYAFLNGKLESGCNVIISKTGLEKNLNDCDLLITGEGSIDYQTKYDKTPIAVAKLAKKYNIPVLAIVGSLGKNYQEVYAHGIDAIIPTSFLPLKTLPEAASSRSAIASATEQALRIFHLAASR